MCNQSLIFITFYVYNLRNFDVKFQKTFYIFMILRLIFQIKEKKYLMKLKFLEYFRNSGIRFQILNFLNYNDFKNLLSISSF